MKKKFKAIVEIESNEEPKYLKSVVSDMLGIADLADTLTIGKIDIKEDKKVEQNFAGLCVAFDGAEVRIVMTNFNSTVNFSRAKAIVRQKVDPYDKFQNDIQIIDAFNEPIIRDALFNHFSRRTIRKVIDDATDRARAEAARKSEAGET